MDSRSGAISTWRRGSKMAATDWLALAYSIYRDQQSPKFSAAPLSPQQQQLFELYTNSLKNPALMDNAAMASAGAKAALGSLNPSWTAPKTFSGAQPYAGRQPMSMDWLKSYTATVAPNQKASGGSPVDRGDMHSPGMDSPIPGGGSDPFAPGWEGQAGVGGPDSPNFQKLLALAKQYGPQVLASYVGGPLGSVALSVYNWIKGKTATPGVPTDHYYSDIPSGKAGEPATNNDPQNGSLASDKFDQPQEPTRIDPGFYRILNGFNGGLKYFSGPAGSSPGWGQLGGRR